MKRVPVEITPEEKARWAPILQHTWAIVASDVLQACGGTCSRDEVVEFACDANRPMQQMGQCREVMTKEEYRVLGQWYGTASFKAWAREVFPSSLYVI